MSDTAARSTGDARPARSAGPKPRKGDKVRYTVEGVVTTVGDYLTRIEQADYVGVSVNHDGEHGRLEILERADDPSKDPIGTVRGADGWIVVRRDTRGSPALPWATLVTPEGQRVVNFHASDHAVSGLPVIGAVPGTPAAEAAVEPAAEEPLAEWERALLEPGRTSWDASGPEPDRSKRYSDSDGWDWSYNGRGWTWTGSPIAVGHTWDELVSDEIPTAAFPWTLVDGQ